MRRVRSILAVALLPTLAGPLCADPGAARELVAAAEARLAQGDREAAGPLLRRAGEACGAARPCQGRVRFAQGYLAERRAVARQPADHDLLVRAAALYREAADLLEDPRPAHYNLALVRRRLGDRRGAIDSMRQSLGETPESRIPGLLFIGDLQAELGEASAAERSYRRALEGDPRDLRGYRRLLRLYREHPPEHLQTLLTLGERLRPWAADLASEAFLVAMRQDPGRERAPVEDALVRWTALQADSGTLGSAALATLPFRELAAPVAARELRLLVEAPLEALSQGTRWWRDTAERRDALARVLRAAGRRALAEGRREAAARLLLASLEAAPDYGAYQSPRLGAYSNARLDAAVDLLALYQGLGRQQDFDTLKQRLQGRIERITGILFSGKAAAYGRDDLPAVQRYHSVLGLIYYEQGRYRSDWADNARYQLSHALKVADRRARRDPGTFRPLPELAIRLARVYAQTDQPRRAANLALRAARDYLDLDQMGRAAQALEEARRDGAKGPSLRALEAIVATRSATGPAVAAEATWLSGTLGPGLPRDFLRRQRFKALADLAGRLQEDAFPAALRRAQLLAAEALEALDGQAVLASPSDLQRLRRLSTTLSRSVVFASGRELVRTSPRGGRPAERRVAGLTLPTAQGALRVQLDPDLLTAAEILRAPTARPLLQSPATRLKIRRGTVTIESRDQDALAGPALRRQLLQLKGVTHLQFHQKGVGDK